MDCDLGLSPEEIPGLVKRLKRNQVAIGSRYVKGGKDPRPMYRVLVSWLINGFAIMVLGSGGVRDYTSGFAAIRKKAMDQINFSRNGFGEYFIEFAYKCRKNNFRIKEVPCVYTIRSKGISKSDGEFQTLLKLGWDYGIKILGLRFNYKR
jgi:dolichol-phosphate mannosyltransferase